MKNSKFILRQASKALSSKFKKFKKSLKKIKIYPLLIVLAMLLVIPLLRYTPLPNKGLQLRGSAPDETAFVSVSVPINEGNYAIFNNETNELVKRNVGSLEKFELKPGQYRIEFSDVVGYTSPISHKFQIEPGADVNIDGYYDPNCDYPLLGLRVFPDNAQYNIFDTKNNEKVASSEGSDFFQLPVGRYRVEFVEMENYTMRKTQTFMMMPRTITTVNAMYGKN